MASATGGWGQHVGARRLSMILAIVSVVAGASLAYGGYTYQTQETAIFAQRGPAGPRRVPARRRPGGSVRGSRPHRRGVVRSRDGAVRHQPGHAGIGFRGRDAPNGNVCSSTASTTASSII